MRNITDLYLFKQFDRIGYKAQFGVDAPTYNTKLPPKSWVDAAEPSGATYNVFDGAGHLVPLVIADAAHAAINLPGIMPYPAYVIDQSSGAMSAMNSTSAYSASLLSTQAQAQALMTELKGDAGSLDDGSTNFGGVIFLAWESRRMWEFKIGGASVNVGTLLGEKYAQGVGAPGHWDTSLGAGNVFWVTEQPTSPPLVTLAPVAVPCSGLLTGESFQQTGLFGFWTIVSTADASLLTGSTSGWSASDDAFLKQLVTDVAAIKAFFRIT